MQSSEKNISGYIHQKHPKCTTFGQVFIEKEGRTDLLQKGKTENFSSCSHHQWAGVM